MKTIRLGVVGLGRGFSLMLPTLGAHPAIRLRGAYDLRKEALSRFTSEFEAPGHHSLEALLADPDIDAVYIATPHGLHAEQAIAALRAGKHVLVEKPMATELADGVAMAQAAEAAGKVLLVGPSHGFDEPVRQAAAMAASGEHGRLRMVTALNFTDFMYRPRRPEELDSARGGGVIFSQATHQIDAVRRIVGEPISSVRAVTGQWDPNRAGESAYCSLLSFVGGAAATLTYSGHAHYDSDELMGWVSELGRIKDPGRYGDARRALAGSSVADEQRAKLARTYGVSAEGGDDVPPHHEHFGFILVSCEKADLRLLPDGIQVNGDDRREFVPIAPPALPRAAVIDAFADAVLGRQAPVHDARWGLETMACCAALLESSRRGIDIDPRTLVPHGSYRTGDTGT